jgi:ARG and Rhodanese-Phosphatase-superfamily-associated Protein domain
MTTHAEYVQALPRLEGQAGVLAGIGGRIACLDYVSRSDAFAGLYLKLLRGYALDAIEAADRPLSRTDVGRFLGELELVGDAATFEGYAAGTRLVVDGETIALTAFRR